MARFHGKVGFGVTVEDPEASGVYVDDVVEYEYFGDVVRASRTLVQGDHLNQDVAVGNAIRIVADAYARGNINAIRYLEWMGVLWTVTSVEVQHPRLLLTMGEVYNGPTPGPPESP